MVDLDAAGRVRHVVGVELEERGRLHARRERERTGVRSVSARETCVHEKKSAHVYGSGHVELRDGALFDPPAEEGESVAVLLDVGFLESIAARGRGCWFAVALYESVLQGGWFADVSRERV